MNKLSTELYNRAREIVTAEHDVIEPGLLIDKLTELVAKQCIYTIQIKVIRDGSTPENLRSWQHVRDMAERVEIQLPIDDYGI